PGHPQWVAHLPIAALPPAPSVPVEKRWKKSRVSEAVFPSDKSKKNVGSSTRCPTLLTTSWKFLREQRRRDFRIDAVRFCVRESSSSASPPRACAKSKAHAATG